MKIEVDTERFGRVEVPEERVYHFPRGLIGFEGLKRFVLLDSRKGPMIQWLQSVDEPGLAFLVADPKTFLPSLEVSAVKPGAPAPPLDVSTTGNLRILTMLSVDRSEGAIRLHVQAPLFLDEASRRAAQLVTETDTPVVSVALQAPREKAQAESSTAG